MHEKGIVLPCPKCFNTVEVKKYDDVISAVKCKCGLSYMPTSMEEQNKFPESWNTRSATPIGRCAECKHAYVNDFAASSGIVLCRLWTNRTDGVQVAMQNYDYCSYFEPQQN